MNKFVKQFIENTKYAISKDMWEVFFYEWYRESVKVFPPEEEEIELFYILKTCKLSVNWNAREVVIKRAIEHIINTVLTDSDNWYGDVISYTYIKDELHTFLGYTSSQIDAFIYDTGVSLGLEPLKNEFKFR